MSDSRSKGPAGAPPGVIGAAPGGVGTAEEGESRASSLIRVQLPAFEGPLDLLLHLIQREEIEITDIPIARIAKEYLDTLDLMRELDLEVAGEFLVMAATLMRIKARMLLPPSIADEEEEDPREGLVRQLLEYRRFKEAARDLERLEAERRLLEASVLEKLADQPFSLEEAIAVIRGQLTNGRRALFEEVLQAFVTRLEKITAFLGLLELLKQERIAVAQEELFGPIWILW